MPGPRTVFGVVMSQQDVFDGVLAALHNATLDDAHWPATSALIHDACGTKGMGLWINEDTPDDSKILFARLYYRDQRSPELEQEYTQAYHPKDERVPRLRKLPDSSVVQVGDLFTEQETRNSPTYNEWLPRSHGQNSLHVRLDGPHGCRIALGICDPIDSGGWWSTQLNMLQRLLPHLRQFVYVRQALASAEAMGASFTELLANKRVGVVHMDRRGVIVRMNDRAQDILRRGDGLSDQGGRLRAWLPADDANLNQLLARALPRIQGSATSGSMMIRRSPGFPRLALHVNPMTVRQMDFGARGVGALLLIVDPTSHSVIEPDIVAATLGLTPSESRVATLLAEGRSVREIASATGRRESSIRWHIKQIYRKLGISRQAELVRLVLSITEFSGA